MEILIMLVMRVASTCLLDKVAGTRYRPCRLMNCHSISMQVLGGIICKIRRVRQGLASVSIRQRWMITGLACKVVVIARVWHQIHSHKYLQPKQISAAQTNTKTKLAIISFHRVQQQVVERISSIISRNTNNNPFSKTSRTLKKKNLTTVMVKKNRKNILADTMSMVPINRRDTFKQAKIKKALADSTSLKMLT